LYDRIVIATRFLRHLDLGPEARGERPFVSAASALVRSGDWLYVIADDDLHLFSFAPGGMGPGRRLRVLPGRLPDETKARKAQKPDFEALVKLPPFGAYSNGALLAIGSGATQRRDRGALVRLDVLGNVASPMVEIIDLTELYARLAQEVSDLNLEGAVVSGDGLFLLQRGNGPSRDNALIRLDLPTIQRALIEDREPPPEALRDVVHVSIGKVGGVELAFTDATALEPGLLLFTAVAENTQSTYLDGENLGACLGVLALDGRVVVQEPLDTPLKIEGVTFSDDEILLVNDSDDPTQPSSLLRAEWSPPRH